MSLPIPVIQTLVALHYAIPRETMRSRTDNRFCHSHPRQVAMMLAREFSGASWLRIGRAFDRDHSTAIHAVQAVHRRMESDEWLRRRIAVLRAKCRYHAELHELDTLSGRVFLAAQKQVERRACE